jgi:hypothetical protein
MSEILEFPPFKPLPAEVLSPPLPTTTEYDATGSDFAE